MRLTCVFTVASLMCCRAPASAWEQVLAEQGQHLAFAVRQAPARLLAAHGRGGGGERVHDVRPTPPSSRVVEDVD